MREGRENKEEHLPPWAHLGQMKKWMRFATGWELATCIRRALGKAAIVAPTRGSHIEGFRQCSSGRIDPQLGFGTGSEMPCFLTLHRARLI